MAKKIIVSQDDNNTIGLNSIKTQDSIGISKSNGRRLFIVSSISGQFYTITNKLHVVSIFDNLIDYYNLSPDETFYKFDNQEELIKWVFDI